MRDGSAVDVHRELVGRIAASRAGHENDIPGSVECGPHRCGVRGRGRAGQGSAKQDRYWALTLQMMAALSTVCWPTPLSLKVVEQPQSLSDLMDFCLNGLLIVEATRGARVPSARVWRHNNRASTWVLQSRSNERG